MLAPGQVYKELNRNSINIRKKPFKYEGCSPSFTKTGYLKRHCRIHSGEKPYKCTAYSATFTEAGHLKAIQV